MTTRTVTSTVAEPAGPRERFGWAPLLVLLTGTFVTFLEVIISGLNSRNAPGRY